MVNGGAGDGKVPARRLVADRYELLFELARGGMGIVHVARLVGAHGFDRLVAVKELLDPDDDAHARESFLAEARVSAKIHHPNVLPTLELFDHDGLPFIVMELVRGVSLWQLLGRYAKAGEPPNVDLSAWIVMQAASGLHAAHELCDAEGRPFGLVHRDVSPQNILLGFDGRICVADFGIAKLRRASLKTDSGMVKGKFAYMSPEQARAQPLDRRSDIFSLGIVLHEALTGSRLFAHDSPTETLLHIIDQPIPSPRSKRPDVPEDLSSIAMKCLARSVDERFPTAEALSRALRSALRARQADADEQKLREITGRLLVLEQRSFDERLGSVAAIDEAPGGLTQMATVIDALPPVFSDEAMEAVRPRTSDAFAPVLPPQAPPRTETSVVLPMRRLPRAAWPSAVAFLLVLVAGGGYAAVRWSATRAAASSNVERAPVEPQPTAAAQSPANAPTTSAPTLAIAADPPIQAAHAASATASASPAKKSAPKKPPAGSAALAPVTTAPAAPVSTPVTTSSKGVPFKDL